jgi:uncharacterized protein (DUF433 family)
MPAAAHAELWRQRLKVPNYGVSEAARYADITSGTIRNWQKLSNRPAPLSNRAPGKGLSYLQLIELAVVAAARHAGVSLPAIRETREYMSRKFESEFPFAEFRFKTDGRELWLDCADLQGSGGEGKLLKASGKGQLAWTEIIGRLHEFDYDEDLATRWHVAGSKSSVVIDPRVQFGKPSVCGIPTWIIGERVTAGDEPDYVARDFGIPMSAVADALAFEGVGHPDAKAWSH